MQDNDENSTDSRKLFIGGVLRSTTDTTFKNFFSKYGELEDIVLMRDKVTNEQRGFGFVTYKRKCDCETVLNSVLVLDDKQLDPKPAIPRSAQGPGFKEKPNRSRDNHQRRSINDQRGGPRDYNYNRGGYFRGPPNGDYYGGGYREPNYSNFNGPSNGYNQPPPMYDRGYNQFSGNDYDHPPYEGYNGYSRGNYAPRENRYESRNYPRNSGHNPYHQNNPYEPPQKQRPFHGYRPY